MSKASFGRIYGMIKDHNRYNPTNNSPRVDIKVQLAIVLEKLAFNGNAASYSRIGRRSGVGSKSKT